MKIKKKGRRKNRKLVKVMGIGIAVYVLFFTSNLWMPVYVNPQKYSAFNREEEFNGRWVKLIRWEYSKEERKMEVELDISNTTFDGIHNYEYSAVTSNFSSMPVETVIEEADMLVLQINDIPAKWGELSLRIEMPDNYKDKSGASILKYYTNIKKIKKVSSLPKKNKNEYMMQRVDTMIVFYEQEITDIERKIEEGKIYRKNCDKEINRLIEGKKYQTEEEIKQTDRLIENANSKMKDSVEHEKEYLRQIEEYRDKISKANKKRELYKE